jgi:hypothetical protein
MRYGFETSAEKEGFNPNPNLAFFGQRNDGRGRGSNRGRNQGSFFNSRGRGFAPANQAVTPPFWDIKGYVNLRKVKSSTNSIFFLNITQ